MEHIARVHLLCVLPALRGTGEALVHCLFPHPTPVRSNFSNTYLQVFFFLDSCAVWFAIMPLTK